MAQPAQNAQPNAREEDSLMNTIWSVGQKAFLAWAVSQLSMRYPFTVLFLWVAHDCTFYTRCYGNVETVANFLQSRAPQPEPPVPVAHEPNAPAEQQFAPVNGFPAWPAGSNLSMHVYFSTSPVGDVFGVTNRKNWGQAEATGGGFPHWTWDNITYGDWVDSRKIDVMVEIPQVSFGGYRGESGEPASGMYIDSILFR
jgi:hypothetical protein